MASDKSLDYLWSLRRRAGLESGSKPYGYEVEQFQVSHDIDLLKSFLQVDGRTRPEDLTIDTLRERLKTPMARDIDKAKLSRNSRPAELSLVGGSEASDDLGTIAMNFPKFIVISDHGASWLCHSEEVRDRAVRHYLRKRGAIVAVYDLAATESR